MLEQVLTSPLVPQSGQADRIAPGPAARALRHLVQRLPPRQPASERNWTGSWRNGIPLPRPTRTTSRICSRKWASRGSRAIHRRPHHRGPGPGLRPCHGSRDAVREGHLRTRIEKTGMNYKASTSPCTRWATTSSKPCRSMTWITACLEGVPNTAFTEALAFVFQGQDMALLD